MVHAVDPRLTPRVNAETARQPEITGPRDEGPGPAGDVSTFEKKTDLSWTDGVARTSKTTAVQLADAPTTTRTGRVVRDPSLKPITDAMLRRLETSNVEIEGVTPRKMFEDRILNNPKITDEMLRKMADVRVDDIADNSRAKARTFKKFPDVQSSVNHRFTRDLIAGITGLDAQAVSDAKPSLGLTGSARSVFSPLWKSSVPKVQRFTALHDTTSVLQSAGVGGFNKAVWGQGSSVLSAVLNFPLGAELRNFFGSSRRAQ